ncbi:MFS transporter [Williamsia phyllosphaerae]|uniref:MFS transporter n=1 Tax=Williamsia phyllosphaerae TaxID=885042 RepID=UPI00166AD09E|nr:MFS transporter [Williamsia phyllosphaerae]
MTSTTTAPPVTRRLSGQRISASAVFGINGLLASMWVSHIPVISDRTGVDHTTLGGLLLILGGSAFVGMQLCGPLIDRWGSRGLTIAGALLLAVGTLGPVFADTALQLALALALFGFGNGALDVSMNSQAVVIEQAYGRPVMSSFHAYFSVGGMVGSGIAAVGLFLDVPVAATVATVAAVSTIAVIATRPFLVAGRAGNGADPVPSGDPISRKRFPPGLRGRIVLMALVAFALMLAEGTAYDWSALHLVERFGTSDAAGAVAFGAFSATMLIGRFAADAVTARFGPVAVVRGGAATAVVGMTVVICAPVPAVAIGGWALFGIGVAGGVPQLFTAAGNVTAQPSGRVISTVVGSGYLGMLAGPALIGPISHTFTLGTALWLAAAAMAFGAAAAGVVRTSGRAPRGSDATARAKLDV